MEILKEWLKLLSLSLTLSVLNPCPAVGACFCWRRPLREQQHWYRCWIVYTSSGYYGVNKLLKRKVNDVCLNKQQLNKTCEFHEQNLFISYLIFTGLYAGSEYIHKRAKGKWCCQSAASRQLVSCGILGDTGNDGDQLLTQWLIFTSGGRRREGEKGQQLSPRQRTDTASSSRMSDQRNISQSNFKSALSVCTVLCCFAGLYHAAMVYKQDITEKVIVKIINFCLFLYLVWDSWNLNLWRKDFVNSLCVFGWKTVTQISVSLSLSLFFSTKYVCESVFYLDIGISNNFMFWQMKMDQWFTGSQASDVGLEKERVQTIWAVVKLLRSK